MGKNDYDFSGYATKNNLKCTDGRVILKDAFKDSNGTRVPLVWQHLHDDPSNVLGHGLLENREDGVYIYGKFNGTPDGQKVKALVQHGDITSLSIYANKLIQKGSEVIHGAIREVSLVMTGANPGAYIDNVSFAHSDGSVTDSEDEAIFYFGLELAHEDKEEKMSETSEETVGDVFNTLSEKQKNVVYALIAAAVDEGVGEDQETDIAQSDEDENSMKHNVFDGSVAPSRGPVLTKEQVSAIFADGPRFGSLRESVIAHAGTYGIDDISYLFPDDRALNNEPTMITRNMEWVSDVLGSVRHTPFSRIKAIFADITEEEARALGYTTGSLKKEEVFKLLKRTTSPTTVYKKQKLDRDDLIDITDFEVVSWLHREMRMMLDEELARAFLISDGRTLIDPNKINPDCIRPIYGDEDFYAHKVTVPLVNDDGDSREANTEEMIEAIIRGRENYKGSGNPAFYTTTSFLTDMLLLKDTTGRRIYPTMAELAAALRVSRIVEVPVMAGLKRTVDQTNYDLIGIIVNLKDYTVGADKGGAVAMFDDFDIDYNQQKYLIETRCSGSLLVPSSALVIERTEYGS